MEQPRTEEVFVKGIDALENGHIYLALACFEQAAAIERTPLHCSYLAYCLAKVRSLFPDAVALCREAIREDPGNALHYLHLGRVYLMSGDRSQALDVLREGLGCEGREAVLRELTLLGERKRPLFQSLARSHPVNRYLGILLKRLGVR